MTLREAILRYFGPIGPTLIGAKVGSSFGRPIRSPSNAYKYDLTLPCIRRPATNADLGKFALYQGGSLHQSGHLTLWGVRAAFTMVR